MRVLLYKLVNLFVSWVGWLKPDKKLFIKFYDHLLSLTIVLRSRSRLPGVLQSVVTVPRLRVWRFASTPPLHGSSVLGFNPPSSLVLVVPSISASVQLRVVGIDPDFGGT